MNSKLYVFNKSYFPYGGQNDIRSMQGQLKGKIITILSIIFWRLVYIYR